MERPAGAAGLGSLGEAFHVLANHFPVKLSRRQIYMFHVEVISRREQEAKGESRGRSGGGLTRRGKGLGSGAADAAVAEGGLALAGHALTATASLLTCKVRAY